MLDAKLQIRPGKTVALVGEPAEPSLEAPKAAPDAADAVLVFAKDQAALDAHLTLLQATAKRGALAWVAYPKAKQMGTDLNRDTIHVWGKGKGLETVRQVAIDEVWSAMRFKAA